MPTEADDGQTVRFGKGVPSRGVPGEGRRVGFELGVGVYLNSLGLGSGLGLGLELGLGFGLVLVQGWG